jgi:hypothetical protein
MNFSPALSNSMPTEERIQQMRENILNNSPRGTDDAMTAIGVTEEFQRRILRRAFNSTLKPGGSNHDLVTTGKWMRHREKTAGLEGAPKGKPVMAYQPTVSTVVEMQRIIGSHADALPPAVIENMAVVADIFTQRSGKSLREMDLYTIGEAISKSHEASATQLIIERKDRETAEKLLEAERRVSETERKAKEQLADIVNRLLPAGSANLPAAAG